MINQYLDSTYLKTPEQSGLTEEQTFQKVLDLTDEAIKHQFYSVMIRPDYVKSIKDYLKNKNSTVQVGTVIGFHEGTKGVTEKVSEAQKAIEDGADELDIVINYPKFINKEIDYIKEEVLTLTKLCLDNQKICKWIIEIAALSSQQVETISALIKDIVMTNFPDKSSNVFVKSSTGFYKTENNKPNGATVEGINLMLKNANPLPVKAAGGVKTKKDAEEMIKIGVRRIGTSSAPDLLLDSQNNSSGY